MTQGSGRASKQVRPEPTAAELREQAELARRSAQVRDRWKHPKPHANVPPPKRNIGTIVGLVALIVVVAGCVAIWVRFK